MGISTWLILSGQGLVLEFPGLKLQPTAQLGPGLDRGYPTDVAVSLQQRLTRIEETTNNVAKKKNAYVSTPCYSDKATDVEASEPWTPRANDAGWPRRCGGAAGNNCRS
jgi:hypothetical protein